MSDESSHFIIVITVIGWREVKATIQWDGVTIVNKDHQEIAVAKRPVTSTHLPLAVRTPHRQE